jgi:hypothetical protein
MYFLQVLELIIAHISYEIHELWTICISKYLSLSYAVS